ncbi:glycosyltransferase [Spiroplasma corruscae]|uniref:Glycosyltransferase n=1 Tax=Spiroplasma corruscae TaxID=216934 RepID=A0A222EMY4_9MOLU|nr:glycosyltransferase family 2 protein [Spiroplasma corruscae]ASP27862.1 glycosyltransferase [Spiroplasma corruscae]
MLISFVLVVPNANEEFRNTVESVLKQNNKSNYELIVVLDRSIDDLEANDYFYSLFKKNKNVKLVFNNDRHGSSYSWNVGIDICSGDYIKFISQGDTLESDFLDRVLGAINSHKDISLDIIEYNFSFKGDQIIASKSYLEPNKVYNLKEDYEPLALTNNLLFNKLFKTDVIKKYNVRFRNQVRFDMLFFYIIYSQSKNYIYLNSKSFENIILRQVQYSNFDIVNQWTHIFNYYRRIKKYNDLHDQLKYSYYKTILHIWIWTIAKTDNKVLIRKALEFVNRKYEPKKDLFVKNNIVFKETKDLTFKELAENFSEYYRDYLKTNK